MDVLDAITHRRSTRAFLNKAVDKETIQQILDVAKWSPSGTNLQPWNVYILTGETLKKVSAGIVDAFNNGDKGKPEYEYYPTGKVEPYHGRRFSCGMALYKALEIGREDTEKRHQNWVANYQFFGAPVGFVLTLDNHLNKGSWIDAGLFLQSVMLSARGHGLETCPEFSIAEFPHIVKPILGIPNDCTLVTGMALGYGDPDAPVNNYRTEREPVDGFTQWFD